MTIKFRPLGIVKEIINELGLDITYAYDDLAFVEHSLIIIKFTDDTPSKIDIFFNQDCLEKTKEELFIKLKKESEKRGIYIISKGEFYLKEKTENEELEITFLEQSCK